MPTVTPLPAKVGVRAFLVPLAPLAALIMLFAFGEGAARLMIYVRYGDSNRAIQETLGYAPYLISLADRIPAASPKRPDTFRVLLLGSSTARGIPDATIAAAFEPIVRRRVEVLNYAQAGHCSQQELVMFALYGMDRHPDLVMTLDGINDIVALTKSGKAGVPYENEMIEQAMADPPGFALSRLFARSQLVNSFRKLGERRLELSIQSNAEAAGEVVSLYGANVEKFAEIANGIGARYVAVLQPYLHLRRNPPEAERTLGRNYEYRRRFLVDMMRRLETAGHEARLPATARFVDATAAFDGSAGICFNDEAHLTPAGQAALLTLVTTRIRDDLAPPADR